MMQILLYSFFFFFQAEDGIRDYKVTGVQTCALPIFEREGGERSGDLGVDRRPIVKPSGIDRFVELLDDDSPPVDHRRRAGDFLVLRRHIAIGRKDRYAAPGIAHEVLNLPALGWTDYDPANWNGIGNHRDQAVGPSTKPVALRDIGKIGIENDGD